MLVQYTYWQEFIKWEIKSKIKKIKDRMIRTEKESERGIEHSNSVRERVIKGTRRQTEGVI